MSKEEIELFKWENKPEWKKITPSLVIAKWIIKGEAWLEAINPQVKYATHGWSYEDN